VVWVVGLERNLQHRLKFTALLAEQECKGVLRLGARTQLSSLLQLQRSASLCTARTAEAWQPGHTAALYFTLHKVKRALFWHRLAIAIPFCALSFFGGAGVFFLTRL
jgi:hypothetical protein